ncbi:hypothetical protein [Nostoc sp. 'Peltigera membranacea cyanobiont' 210A]|nr:hypothetical protein [Nostoc sp. 'Peltigera membranacea cyanobiont' 210A]
MSTAASYAPDFYIQRRKSLHQQLVNLSFCTHHSENGAWLILQ